MVKLVNRAKMTTATTGTGTITLGSAVDGFQTFAAAGVANADVVRYVIEDGTEWEIGTGTFDSAAGTLTRSPSESSIGGGAITLTGEAVVFVSATSADFSSGAGGATVSDTPPATPADGDLWYDTKSGAMFVYYVGPSSSVWVSVADAAPSIPIEFVSQATATTTSISTMPTHKAGDLLLMFAYRNNSTFPPALPAGWRNITNTGGNTNSMRIAFKIAANASEASGTWNNATELNLHVYRNSSGVGASGSQNGSGTTLTYGGLTLQQTNGSSQVALFGGHRSTNTAINTPPTGTVLRSNTARAAGFDTDGGVTSWSEQTVNVGGTSSGWVTGRVELLASHPAILDTLDFPASPDVGDVYTESGITFVWDGVVWSNLAEKNPFAGRSWVEIPSPPTSSWFQNTSGDALILKPEIGGNSTFQYYINHSAPSFSGATEHRIQLFGLTENNFEFVDVRITGTELVTIILPDGHYIHLSTSSNTMLELR